ncbi:MAG: hypothetical protein C5B59_06700 [Bacteroidetes bacterium]|nr:MAG: hypothetical protein C5B59_06700 [Bacteroidota bacterium]
MSVNLQRALEQKARRLKARYNQTLEQHDALRQEQNNSCALCHRSFDEFLAFQDHDHKCCGHRSGQLCGKCNRGLLCFLCNKRVIGALETIIKFKGNVEAALEYIRSWDAKLKERGAYEGKKKKKLRKKQKSL